MDYKSKYLKYKEKYNNLKNNNLKNNKLKNNKLKNNKFMYGGNKSQKIILLDGTSSAGKSTFCKYFKTKDYECFSIDNYWSDKRVEEDIKNVSNEYNAEQNIYSYNKMAA
jgi:chloramphenicol 3-O-phosphotransferase